MKIAGVDPKTLSPEYTLVLPRGEDLIVFKARGLVDFEEFHKFVPEPVPPRKMTRDGLIADTNNANYTNNGVATDPTNHLTPVGAFLASPGPYGTFDMGGDVYQWNEAKYGQGRGSRGGATIGGVPHQRVRGERAGVSLEP